MEEYDKRHLAEAIVKFSSALGLVIGVFLCCWVLLAAAAINLNL